ncbi:hypothetical protein AAE485_01175 [Acidithiobacillus ferriphilus]|uniref:hypothetical protein n=1 Tax=Acidithiobacillus TaxID=119977 RepID=UPI0025BB70DD|nr:MULTISPECIES: hypothetical protein [Acidithiobacillus]MEB8534731.1 hypothetical protein [Acidithiobacillus ferriphilus]
MKTIIFSHGDKGGVGKSVVAALLVDMALQRFGRASLIEGDAKTPDVFARYQDDPQVVKKMISLNLAGDAATAVGGLAEWLENENPDDHLVTIVNLPANAGETLDGLVDLIIPVCTDLGYDVAACYSLGKGAEASLSLQQSLDSGLLSKIHESRRLIIIPEFAGTRDSFNYTNKAVAEKFLYEKTVLPKLAPVPTADVIFRSPGAFSTMAKRKPEGFGVFQAHTLKRWLKDCFVALDPVFPEPPALHDDMVDGERRPYE